MRKVLCVFLVCLLGLLACAKMRTDWKAKGGIVGSYKGDYIVVNHSGGRIMDVWKLESTIVKSEASSDGWVFIVDGGNVVQLGGDVKVIRVNDSKTWDRYREFHAEFGGTYK